MSSNEKISCEDIKEQLVAYLDNELQDDEFAIIDDHVKGCLACKTDLRDLRSVSSMLGSLPKEELEVDFALDVEKLIAKDETVSNSSCEQFQELISPYYDNELDESTSKSLETHLNRCEPCSTSLEEITAVSQVLRGLPKETLGYDLSENIEDLLENSSRKGAVVPFKSRVAVISSIAAAMVLFVVLSVPRLMNTNSNDAPQVAKNTQSSPVNDKNIVANKAPEKSPVETVKSVEVSNNIAKVASTETVVKDSPVKKLTASVVSKAQVEKKMRGEKILDKEISMPPVEVAMSSGGDTAMSASQGQAEPDQLLSTEAVVAFESDDDDDLFSQMGVSTDEDGLYAIKL